MESKVFLLAVFSIVLLGGCLSANNPAGPGEGSGLPSGTAAFDASQYNVFDQNGVKFYYPKYARISFGGTNAMVPAAQDAYGSEFSRIETTTVIFALNSGSIYFQKIRFPFGAGGPITREYCRLVAERLPVIENGTVSDVSVGKLGGLTACKIAYQGTNLKFTLYYAVEGTETYSATHYQSGDGTTAPATTATELADFNILVSSFEVTNEGQ